MIYHFHWDGLSSALPALAQGMRITLQITAVAIIAGIALGTILAMFWLSSSKPLAYFAYLYVTFFRAIPLVMVLLWFFLLIPQILQSLLSLPPDVDIRFVCALIAFSLFEAAYYAEIIRAGVQSVSRGQLNAARALGMSYQQSMRLIILPQAFRAMIPLLLTQGIVLFQDTSLVYVMGLADFFHTAAMIGQNNGRVVEMILLAGAVYFVICALASTLVKLLQRNTRHDFH